MAKAKAGIHYEIEGYYPVGNPAGLKGIDPKLWRREWRHWHTTPVLAEARATLRTGKYLCHRTCPLSYTMLRIVRVDQRGRKVIK